MIKEFLQHLESKGYAAATLEASRRWLKYFEARYPVTVDKLRPRDLSAYRQSLCWEPGLRGKLYSENTVNQAVGVLRSYFRWCVEQGLLQKSPAEHLVTRSLPPTKPVVLSPAQTRAVLALPDLDTAVGLRDRAMLGLFVEERASGCSLSRLDIGDFQPDTGALLLRSRKRRIIFPGVGLLADLERYLRLGRAGVANPVEKAFFVTRSGQRMGRQNPLRILGDYCRLAGVPRPTLLR